MESYLLDALWLNLETLAKAKKIAPILQNFQFPSSQPNLNPPFVQPAPLAPNPLVPMAAARFAPLALPAALHDLPLNYAQRIALYDGEENVSARYHVGKFDDFIDLEEVDHEDAKMSLFAQTLSGESKKWYKYLLARSIPNSVDFQTTFLERWDDKQSPLQVLSQYNNLKKGGFESFHDFSNRFMRLYNSIPNDINPSPCAAKLHYAKAFDNDFSLLLSKRK